MRMATITSKSRPLAWIGEGSAFTIATPWGPSSAPPVRRWIKGPCRARPSPSNSLTQSQSSPKGAPAPVRASGAVVELRRRSATGCGEERRVRSRCRLAWVLGCTCLTLSVTGCSDEWNAGPLQYVENEALTRDLGAKAHLAGKPNLQRKVRGALAQLFGES